MPTTILDTSVLIGFWNRQGGNSPKDKTPSQAEEWGKVLAKKYGTNSIVTPVYLEFVAGVTSAHQLQLARAFMKHLEILDEGKISAEDWKEARRIAERVPQTPARRQLGDCLIRALGNRFRATVATTDAHFPH